jgi:tol-pal system protein YbgF
MVLNSLDIWVGLRRMACGVIVASTVLLMGCGSSEETTMEDEGFEEEPVAETAEKPAKEDAEQQALTSFIGAAPKKEQPVEKKEGPPPTKPEEPVKQPVTPSMGTAEELRMENTSLKQQLVKLEQDTRSLGARLSDAEAKYMAEKQRAERAEEAARVAAQSAAISARGGTGTPSEPISTEANRAYDDALQSFRMKAYDDAAMRFQSLLDAGVSRQLADNCHYWIGESHYGKKSYAEAVKHFQTVLQYDDSEKLADAHFMLAQCYERMGDKAKAKQEYEIVAKDFPMSANASRAKDRSARM